MKRLQIVVFVCFVSYEICLYGNDAKQTLWHMVGAKYAGLIKQTQRLHGQRYVQENSAMLMDAFLWNIRSFYGSDLVGNLSPSAVRAAGRDYLSRHRQREM